MTNEELNRKISEARRGSEPCDRIGGCLKTISRPDTGCKCDQVSRRDWTGSENANATLLDELPQYRRQLAMMWQGEQRRRAVCEEWLEEHHL